MKKAILVVSFGTSYEETRKKTIEAIEKRIDENFEVYKVYRAFTSKIILKKLKMQGLQVFDVDEAMRQILKDGVEQLVVQPTHIINGIENDNMYRDVMKYEGKIASILFGKALLSDTKDYQELARIIDETYPVGNDEVLLLMGHGSDHYANASYPAFEYTLKQDGFSQIVVGTVEGYPSFADACDNLKRIGKKKVCLDPMMIVAGDHATNDMAGSEDSWKTKLEADGYEVRCVMAGLGEIRQVQDMYVKHIENALMEENGIDVETDTMEG